MTFKPVTLALLLLIASQPSSAVELQPGVVYQAGTEVESSQLGVALTIPQDWVGALPQGSEVFVLESARLQARLYLKIDAITRQQMIQTLSGPVPLGSGVVLQPTSKPMMDKDLVKVDYQASDMTQSVPAFAVGRALKPGLSAAVFVLPANQGGVLKQAASRILNSIETRAVSQTVQSIPSAGANSWQEYLRGRHIQRYFTQTGYLEEQRLWLCSDGSFRKSFKSGGYSPDQTSGATQSGAQGRWYAQGETSGEGTLVLQFTEGGSASYRLTLQKKLYLDGVQWLRVKNEYCQ